MRDCEECNGTGKVDVMNCKNQSNECCGGCYKDVQCDECDGSGEWKYGNPEEGEERKYECPECCNQVEELGDYCNRKCWEASMI